MASLKKRLKSNVDGEFYVDSTCINCGVCRWIAPEVFDGHNGKSRVWEQPGTEKETYTTLKALVSCPTASIGSVGKKDPSVAIDSYPDLIDGNVYHCGFHSHKSFGATSYFIKRKEGNILVDSPRFVPALVRKLEEMGGVDTLFLTHKDDVADHRKYRDHFGCTAILHRHDRKRETSDIECFVEGEEPLETGKDLLILPVPGHTKGSLCLLYKNRYLFTGDHLAKNPLRKHPTAFNNHCWYDWKEQIRSMKKTANYDFEWILPGHGLRCHYPLEEMKKMMGQCIAWMENLS